MLSISDMNERDKREIILEALDCIPVSDLDYRDWMRIGIALEAEGFDFETWDRFSWSDRRYNRRVCEQMWKSFKKKSYSITFATIFWIAKKYGWRPPIMQDAALGWDSVL